MLKPLVPIAMVLAALTAGSAGAGTTSVDFGVTLTGPAKAKVGANETYTVTVTNAGPDTESPKMRLAGGAGATDTSTGEPVKTISQTPTQGACKNDGFGVTCRLGDIAPGATVTVTVGLVEPLERDVPRLDLQATIEPEKASAIDTNSANNHVELVTEVPTPIKIEGVPSRCTSKTIVLRVRAEGRAGGEADQGRRRRQGGRQHDQEPAQGDAQGGEPGARDPQAGGDRPVGRPAARDPEDQVQDLRGVRGEARP